MVGGRAGDVEGASKGGGVWNIEGRGTDTACTKAGQKGSAVVGVVSSHCLKRIEIRVTRLLGIKKGK